MHSPLMFQGLAAEVRELMLLTLLVLASQATDTDVRAVDAPIVPGESTQRIRLPFRPTPRTARRAPSGISAS